MVNWPIGDITVSNSIIVGEGYAFTITFVADAGSHYEIQTATGVAGVTVLANRLVTGITSGGKKQVRTAALVCVRLYLFFRNAK